MEQINVQGAPAAIGPYAHAVRTGDLLFISGQVPFDPETGEVVGKTMAEQTRQAVANLETVLKGAGLTKTGIVKVTAFLADYNAFQEFNAAYAEFLGSHRPARTTVEVSRLPKNVLLEIDAIAEYK
ncbi:MAG: Rid family detoxifying hydrolase [Deltaproteobacteria bacterium]|jgi:2-iminobutanoate/2-iminopropanoate deaminase|nr:Rid family detoxifying hydrolase [Deltaproteobacteria bacterium]